MSRLKTPLMFTVLLAGWVTAMPIAQAAPAHWITDDFFTQMVSGSRSHRFSETVDCRARIHVALCLVDPVPADQPPGEDAPRTCLSGGEVYAGVFEKLYDQYPPALQKMFCSIEKIYIEKEFVGTAYAGELRNADGSSRGAVVGVRKSLLDTPFPLQFWASWKEQLSFGGIYDRYELTPGLPVVSTTTSAPVDDFLYFVFAHEFGHLFDFANGVNQFQCPPGQSGDDNPPCPVTPGSWSALTWQTTTQVLPKNDFFGHGDLCFYWCDGHAKLSAADEPKVYEGLMTSGFISLYGSTNPYDDFAEALAYSAIHERLQSNYQIGIQNGASFDMIAHLAMPDFAGKAQYVKDFFARTDIKYP